MYVYFNSRFLWMGKNQQSPDTGTYLNQCPTPNVWLSRSNQRFSSAKRPPPTVVSCLSSDQSLLSSQRLDLLYSISVTAEHTQSFDCCDGLQTEMSLWLVVLALVIVVLTTSLVPLVLRVRRQKRVLKNVPGLPETPILGHGPHFMNKKPTQLLETLVKCASQFGNIFKIHLLHETLVVVSDPKILEVWVRWSTSNQPFTIHLSDMTLGILIQTRNHWRLFCRHKNSWRNRQSTSCSGTGWATAFYWLLVSLVLWAKTCDGCFQAGSI